MKRINKFFALCFLVILSISNTFAAEEIVTKSLFQVSTLQALLAGEYDGVVSIEYLLNKGNMGLGTFDKLDGEMIIWDGVVYQGRVDGKVYVVAPEVKTPFANVAKVSDTESIDASFVGGYDGLKALINKLFPEENKPVLFCITGEFSNLSYRSVPAQEKPYLPLVEVVKEQVVFKKSGVKGVLVGFRFPKYMSGINVAGFHLHFLSDDKELGGHLFDVESGEISIQGSTLNTLELYLPDTISVAKMDRIDAKNDAEAVEKLKK